MTYRITLVLEYPSFDSAPRIGPNTTGADLGEFKVCALQFSDALAELNALEEVATEAARDRTFAAALSYPGCTDPRAKRIAPPSSVKP